MDEYQVDTCQCAARLFIEEKYTLAQLQNNRRQLLSLFFVLNVCGIL